MDAVDALITRQSAKTYGATAPTREHLERVLQAAVRAPDHGLLRPWRFMIIEGDQRRKLGDLLAASALRRVPATAPPDAEANVGLRAAAETG